jgi:hypothetical protein
MTSKYIYKNCKFRLFKRGFHLNFENFEIQPNFKHENIVFSKDDIRLNLKLFFKYKEKSFLKLKLIKFYSYLRSIMSQQGLSGLAILSIGKDMLEKIDYKSVINNFASKTTRNSNNFFS